MKNLAEIFKAYDIRGIYPNQLDENIARLIGKSYARLKKPKKIVVGGDVRHSTAALKTALTKGLLDSGVDVVDIGTITTDQLYFAVAKYGYDGGISVTASHNPAEYNGFKFSGPGGAPVSVDFLAKLQENINPSENEASSNTGSLSTQEILEDYISLQMSFIDPGTIKPMYIVANANFGAVGKGVDRIAEKIGLNIERLNWNEDGTFPKGTPNPLLPENREETIGLIKEKQPDFGVAWDADADRVFFFSGDGLFIPSCYIISLLAKEFLKKYPGSKIVHDTTTNWVIDEITKQSGGIPVHSRTGHTFLKAVMRQENAPFGGESSGHYYFRDSFYADNGIAPLLLIIELLSRTGKTLEQLVSPLMDQYKISGEINFSVRNPSRALALLEKKFGDQGNVIKTDGLVIETNGWRFSARPSNTEPLFRFNAESKNQEELDLLVDEVTRVIEAAG